MQIKMMNMLILLSFVISAYSWWCSGHMTTAMIAQLDLQENSPSVLEKANSILSVLDGKLTHGLSNTFVESACWADDLKTFGLNAMNNWHFINQPYNEVGLLSTPGKEPDVLQTLDKVLATLSLSPEASFENSFMMRYLIHLMGDLHQPLHVTSMFNRKFSSGDAGGNLFKIEYDDNITELHALWDACMGVMGDLIPRPLNTYSYLQIETWGLWAMGNYTRESLSDLLSVKDRNDWARYNFHVAKDHSYNGIKPGERPSEEYLQSNWEIVLRQLALGGYRLADTLKDLYS